MRWARRVVTTVMVLLLAAAANYAIAWNGLSKAVTGGTHEFPSAILSAPLGRWPQASPEWPPPHVAHVSCRGLDSTVYAVTAQWTPAGLIATEGTSEVSRSWQELKVGVPFRCAVQTIRQENWHVPVPAGHVPAPRFDDGIAVLGTNMPWRPLWPGFLANTCLIAVPLAVFVWLPGHAGRWNARLRAGDVTAGRALQR